MITGYSPEQWDLQSRDIDPETGFDRCHVRKLFLDTTERVTVYRLVRFPDGWRNVGQFIPHFKGFRACPEKRGVKLSNSRLDLTLRSYAETGHGHAYA